MNKPNEASIVLIQRIQAKLKIISKSRNYLIANTWYSYSFFFLKPHVNAFIQDSFKIVYKKYHRSDWKLSKPLSKITKPSKSIKTFQTHSKNITKTSPILSHLLSLVRAITLIKLSATCQTVNCDIFSPPKRKKENAEENYLKANKLCTQC